MIHNNIVTDFREGYTRTVCYGVVQSSVHDSFWGAKPIGTDDPFGDVHFGK